MPAPEFVTSRTVQAWTPAPSLKNKSAPLSILVLPIDLRSLVSVMRILNELLVDPTMSVMARPYPSMDEAPRYRSPRDNHAPQMPDLRPSGRRVQMHRSS